MAGGGIKIETATDTTTLADLIRAYRTKTGLSQRGLDRAIGWPEGYTDSLEGNRTKLPRPEALNAISRVTGVPVLDALIAMGYDIQPSRPNVNPRLLAVIEAMTPEQQATLANIALALVANPQ